MGFQYLRTYITAKFPWLAELFLFLLNNENDRTLINLLAKNSRLTCSSPFSLTADSQKPELGKLFLGHSKEIALQQDPILILMPGTVLCPQKIIKGLVNGGAPLCWCFFSLLGSWPLGVYSVLELRPSINLPGSPAVLGAAAHILQRAMPPHPRLSQSKCPATTYKPYSGLGSA